MAWGVSGTIRGVMERRRMTGVLLPVFSLRRQGDAGIGDLMALEEWIDWAADHRVGFLQLLPVNELGNEDVPSPYSAISSIALEPLYLSLERVPGMPPGELPSYRDDLPPLQLPAGRDLVDYARMRAYKGEWLRRAWKRFSSEQEFADLRESFRTWTEQQSDWLEDYSTYRVLCQAFGTSAWWTWPVQDTDVARRFVEQDAEALNRKKYRQWLQWLCAREWALVRKRADAKNVLLMGDVPIGISVASSDVFFNRYLFDMNWSGGAPAEGNFAEDPFTAKWGQNWGIPLYRWDVMQNDGLAWWVRRIRKLAEIFGMYRIDHILGFYRIYAFPWMPARNSEFLPLNPDEAAARCDGRRPGFRPRPDDTPEQRRQNLMQGDTLLRTILRATPGQCVIGEDLGCVPDYVRPDLSRLRIAGFKIPHWECDRIGRIIRGDTYNPCSFATYATHDFPPLCVDWNEWYNRVQQGREAVKNTKLSPEEIREVLRIARDCGETLCRLGDYADLGKKESLVPWGPKIKDALYRALLHCRSDYATLMWTELFDIPVRLNLPGTTGGTNWRPRMPFTAAQAAALPQSAWIKEISIASGR